MSFNYGEDLNFIWDIEQGADEYKIPKLTLQPLLENSITHGIKPKKGKGEIKIEGRFCDEGICFVVSDDGVGMTPEELEKVRNSLENFDVLSGDCIGLKNVNQRIKLFFGGEYGIKIDSEKNKGTRVTIVIPKV